MQKNNTVNHKRRTGLFFLGLFNGKSAQLINGVEIAFGTKGPAIVLPSFKETPNRLNLAILDRNKPAKIVEVGPEGKKKSKVFNANFRVYGGKFKDPGSVLTIIDAPEDDTRIFIIAGKQWDFQGKLDYFQGIQVKAHAGEPDGSVAPGLMILKDGDAIKFIHEGKTYKLTNLLGEPHLIGELPVVAKKVKAAKPVIEVVADNRTKIAAPGLTVVKKVVLNAKKEVAKTTPVAEVIKPTTPVKKEEPRKQYYVEATAKLGAFTGGDKLAALLIPVAPEKKVRTAKATTTKKTTKAKAAVA